MHVTREARCTVRVIHASGEALGGRRFGFRRDDFDAKGLIIQPDDAIGGLGLRMTASHPEKITLSSSHVSYAAGHVTVGRGGTAETQQTVKAVGQAEQVRSPG